MSRPSTLLPLALCALLPCHGLLAQEPATPLPEAALTPSTVEAPPSDAVKLDPPPASAPAPAAPKSQTVVVNLINRMVERGLLTKEDASDLIKQAEEDAVVAQQQAAMAQAAAEQASTVALMLSSREAGGGASPFPDPLEWGSADDTVRVTYIPENIRNQMREEIKADVMAQAREENWAAPNSMPAWARKVRLFGDVRARYEFIAFPDGNDNTGAFPDFNAINTGRPFDVAGYVFSPQLNTDQDRQRPRLRVRVGGEVTLAEGFSMGLRVATGNDNSPVSTNQSLGAASGQGGNFSKYAIWLDRGYIRYEGGDSERGVRLSVGRFDNPFFSSEVMWDDDIGFDGFAVEGRYRIGPVTPFMSGGLFPVFNTGLNYATNQPAKFKSNDKWLYGIQLGLDWKIREDLEVKFAAAYYDFDKIEGKLSDPFIPLTPDDAGNTDASRPAFAQKGNTYMALRDIISSPLNNYGTLYQYQYFGLATPFRVLALTGKLTYNRFEPIQISLSGEYMRNLAFDQNKINAIAVNNRGPMNAVGLASYDGGDTAWIAGLKVGHTALQKRWDWNVGVNYRYVESDAVVDGFTDSDFGGGGTNLKGYTIFANVALSPDVSMGIRWMAADEIAGPPLKIDVFQIDLSAKF